MTPKFLIGDLVTKRKKTDVTATIGLVIGAKKANTDPLDSGSQTSNRYPFVYYVLFNDGNITGPLYMSELRRIST